MYRTDFWTLWGKARVGCFYENSIETCILSRVKQITSPGWMHETSARTWCTGKTQRDRVEREWEGGSGWGIHVYPWLIHVNVWQNPLQYCKVISLQLIKKKKDCVSEAYMEVCLPRVPGSWGWLEVPGGNSLLGGEEKGQDPLSEKAAAHEAMEASWKEHQEETRQSHRGPRDPWISGVTPTKLTVYSSCLAGPALPQSPP